jgi:hypothetical protein
MKYKLPCGYTLRFEGIGLHVEKTGSSHLYFQSKGKESGLPARVEVVTGRGMERKLLLLSEKDFLADGVKKDKDGLGFRVTGRCRGLTLTQSVRCAEVKIGGRKLLDIARRLTLEIESVEFTAPEYVRLLMLTRWGEKGKGRSFELSEWDRGMPRPLNPQEAFGLGRAIARIFRPSPWRVALVATLDWSHTNDSAGSRGRFHPDMEADLRRHEEYKNNQWVRWEDEGNWTYEQMEDHAQWEFLVLFILCGAMKELGARVTYSDLEPHYIFNENFANAIFEVK